MKSLPPLTIVLAKGPEAGHEFERLMKNYSSTMAC
jgi:hypothetical protein